MTVLSRTLGGPLCEALGLDADRVRSIDISLKAGELVEVRVAMWLQEGEVGPLLGVMKQYQLVPKTEEGIATTVGSVAKEVRALYARNALPS